MSGGPRRPDQPRLPDHLSDDDLTEDEHALVAALVDRLSDGQGTTDAFDRSDWQAFGQAILYHSGADPDDVVLLVSDDDVQFISKQDYLEHRDRKATAVAACSKLLRERHGYDSAAIAAMDDLDLLRAFEREETDAEVTE